MRTFILQSLTYSLALSVFLSLTPGAVAEAARCESLIQGAAATPYEPDLPIGLREHRRQEVANLSRGDVQRLNETTLRRLTTYVPPICDGKARAITFDDGKNIIDLVQRNEVTGYDFRERYQRPGVEIGFCFGRATFVHLALLKMGLYRDSIVKLWAVGTMETPGVTWDFHVATAAYVKDRGWMVLDSNYSEPMTVNAWFNEMREQNERADGKLRLYVSEPNRFGVDTGKYSRVQLGLDLNRETDWYQHYFVDMMETLAGRSPEQLGLRRLPPDEMSPPPVQTQAAEPSRGIFDIIRDFFRD